ncbi:MAG TPA: hypothetical protein VIK14_16010 [Ignavibacteria bacterium]
MIAVLIFFVHAIFAVWAFSKSYQNDSWLQAFLNFAFIIILFSVGWTVSDLLMGLFIRDSGYILNVGYNPILLTLLKISGFYRPQGNGMALLLPKDTLSLVLLSTIEYFFYKFYFQRTKNTATA